MKVVEDKCDFEKWFEKWMDAQCPHLMKQVDEAFEKFYSLPEEERKKILENRVIKYAKTC
ncbi:MAG: hypothetical protein EHM25_00360 [Nitrosopumilales archaeon]|nr:MAG: hypothetical protein EHM25_00360 [Nitrosopumilales archaeon]